MILYPYGLEVDSNAEEHELKICFEKVLFSPEAICKKIFHKKILHH